MTDPKQNLSRLPRWRSHKVVRAAPVRLLNLQVGLVTVDHEGGPLVIHVPSNFAARGEPNPGDYLVVYDDGYVSWSPKEAFEDGYTRA